MLVLSARGRVCELVRETHSPVVDGYEYEHTTYRLFNPNTVPIKFTVRRTARITKAAVRVLIPVLSSR